MATINQDLYNDHNFYALDTEKMVYSPLKPTDTEMSEVSTNPVSNSTIVRFVNSSIEAWAAFYLTKDASGNQFSTRAELMSATKFYYAGKERVPTNNDYTIVTADEAHDGHSTRYTFLGKSETSSGQWQYQYTYNYQFTQAQWNVLNSGINATQLENLNAHTVRTDNPHGVTKTQIGLSNVDNTSDTNKPISTAVQTALNGKAASSHTHSKGDIGLGNVDDISVNTKMNRTDNVNASNTAYGTIMARGIYAGTGGMTAGSTGLTSGVIYLQYE